MAIVRTFKGIRPPKDIAPKLASLPYDVLNSEEARKVAEGNPYCFLRVTKPEIELEPEISLYDPCVYEKAKANFEHFKKMGYLVQDSQNWFYVYQQKMGNRSQTGLVACCSAEDYWADNIKKHELTRIDKEEDRLKHVDIINANGGPVFLTYHAKPEINAIIETIISMAPEIDFSSDDGIRHTLWVIKQEDCCKKLVAEFAKIPVLYVADGHHRTAAAARIARVRKAKNPNHTGEEEYNFFLAVLFPHDHLFIMSYNRAVKDLYGLTQEEFISRISEKFFIKKTTKKEPSFPNSFGMYLHNQWYELIAKPGSFDQNDCIESLDVSILQKNLLFPILGISDPRKDNRIEFIGGIRGTSELEYLVNERKCAVSFSLFPTSIEQLMKIADQGKIMPPKSTWFEPKLRSGMVIHSLED